MHLKIIHLILWDPELVEGYLINPFMTRAPEVNSFNPLPTANMSKVLNGQYTLISFITIFATQYM